MLNNIFKKIALTTALSVTFFIGESNANLNQQKYIKDWDYDLQLNDKERDAEFNINKQQTEKINYERENKDSVSKGTQQLLGFLGGGPLGVKLSPIVYNYFGGNLIIWALVGAIAGGFIWSIQVSLFIGILSAIGSIFSLIFKPEEK